jgi:tRNA-splicing ligase RtcB
LLEKIIADPQHFANDPVFGRVAQELIRIAPGPRLLSGSALEYVVYGAEAIEDGALQQMETAMKLPVTIAGALMPDAHQGYAAFWPHAIPLFPTELAWISAAACA